MGLSILDDQPKAIVKELVKLLIKQGVAPETLKELVDIAAKEAINK